MDDRQLDDILSRVQAPEPSKEAQGKALNGALAAFDKNLRSGRVQKRTLTDIPIIKYLFAERYALPSMAASATAIFFLVNFNNRVEQMAATGVVAEKAASDEGQMLAAAPAVGAASRDRLDTVAENHVAVARMAVGHAGGGGAGAYGDAMATYTRPVLYYVSTIVIYVLAAYLIVSGINLIMSAIKRLRQKK